MSIETGHEASERIEQYQEVLASPYTSNGEPETEPLYFDVPPRTNQLATLPAVPGFISHTGSGILVPYDFDNNRVMLERMDPSLPGYEAFAIEEEEISLPELRKVGYVLQIAFRVPTRKSYGGLAETAIFISLEQGGDWAGITEDESQHMKRMPLANRDGITVNTMGVSIPKKTRDLFYQYISRNEWFAAHGPHVEDLVDFHDEDGYNAKLEVSKIIGEICNNAPKDAIIIFHDNHVNQAARYTNKETALVIHTPVPELSTLEKFPHAKETLADMLQNRLIVVQTERNRQKLIAAIEKFFGEDDGLEITVDGESITIKTNDSKNGKPTFIDVIPVGVDPISLRTLTRTRAAVRRTKGFAKLYRGKDIHYTYGRTDPTKAEGNFVEAIEENVEIDEAIRDYFLYIIHQPESRFEVHPSYPLEQLRTKNGSQRVNSKNGRETVVFHDEAAEGTEKSALLHTGGSILASWEEGFGLSGIEGIVATLNRLFRALISRPAGARELLGDTVVSFEPDDHDSIGKAINQILTMSEGEAGERLYSQRKILYKHTVRHWVRGIINKMDDLRQRESVVIFSR